jgi:hypothetical protein
MPLATQTFLEATRSCRLINQLLLVALAAVPGSGFVRIYKETDRWRHGHRLENLKQLAAGHVLGDNV